MFKQAIIAICGEDGSGKSTAGLWIGEEYRAFSFNLRYSYGMAGAGLCGSMDATTLENRDVVMEDFPFVRMSPISSCRALSIDVRYVLQEAYGTEYALRSAIWYTSPAREEPDHNRIHIFDGVQTQAELGLLRVEALRCSAKLIVLWINRPNNPTDPNAWQESRDISILDATAWVENLEAPEPTQFYANIKKQLEPLLADVQDANPSAQSSISETIQ